MRLKKEDLKKMTKNTLIKLCIKQHRLLLIAEAIFFDLKNKMYKPKERTK